MGWEKQGNNPQIKVLSLQFPKEEIPSTLLASQRIVSFLHIVMNSQQNRRYADKTYFPYGEHKTFNNKRLTFLSQGAFGRTKRSRRWWWGCVW